MSILQIVTLVLEAILGLFTAYAAYSLFTSTPPSVAKMREALWMIAYFVVATFTHLVRKDFANLGMPLLFLAIFVGLLVLRWPDATPMLALVGR